MSRPIVRISEICGGAPCIQGTRLTCSNVVLYLDQNGHDVNSYLKHFPSLNKEDVRTCLEYCSEQRCLTGDAAQYCFRCSLDKSPPPPFPDAYVTSPEQLETLRKQGEIGQVFLGSEEEYMEDIRPKDVWRLAENILRTWNSA